MPEGCDIYTLGVMDLYARHHIAAIGREEEMTPSVFEDRQAANGLY